MQIRFLGHAAVLLRADCGTSLLLDPYNPGGFGGRMDYQPIPYAPDAVVCSHAHLDHAAHESLPGQPCLFPPDAPLSSFGPFEVRRHHAWHDEYRGRRRGGQVDILQIRVDGLTLVHLSDIGQAPTPRLIAELAGPDVLFLPVGGFYTVGPAQAFSWWQRLGARLCVPIHYRTPQCTLPLAPVSAFLGHLRRDQVEISPAGGSFIELDSTMINFSRSVVVLSPEC